MMRGAIVVLALMLAVASAGMALCEMDCASGGRGNAAVSSPDAATSGEVMSCHGGEIESSAHNSSLPHGSSQGNKNHAGGHLHARIIATATAKIPTVRAVPISIAHNLHPSVRLLTNAREQSRPDQFSPPINPSSSFATGVLRI